MLHPYRFIGGRYHGGVLPVAQPADVGLELRVRSIDPADPSEFYVLQEDGCFHCQEPAQLNPTVREAAKEVHHEGIAPVRGN